MSTDAVQSDKYKMSRSHFKTVTPLFTDMAELAEEGREKYEFQETSGQPLSVNQMSIKSF